MQCNESIIHQIASLVSYDTPQSCDKQIDWHNTVNITDKVLKRNWQDDQVVPKENLVHV